MSKPRYILALDQGTTSSRAIVFDQAGGVVGGAVIQWLRDELQLVRSVPDAGGLFLVPAFVGLGAPHWDPYARGARWA